MIEKFIKKEGRIYQLHATEAQLSRFEKRLIALQKAHEVELAELEKKKVAIDEMYKASIDECKADIKAIKKLTK